MHTEEKDGKLMLDYSQQISDHHQPLSTFFVISIH
jgi:hypothetical protein